MAKRVPVAVLASNHKYIGVEPRAAPNRIAAGRKSLATHAEIERYIEGARIDPLSIRLTDRGSRNEHQCDYNVQRLLLHKCPPFQSQTRCRPGMRRARYWLSI